MSNPMILLLDMDGVICNFRKGADRLHGPGTLDWSKWSGGLTPELFWEPINEEGLHFWRSLEPYPWKDLLVSRLMEEFEDIYICTSPALEPCSTAKVEWIEHHLPPELSRSFILTKHKHLLAQPGRILLDDNEKNTKRFQNSGGHGVLFPQPWNPMNRYIPSSISDRVDQIMRSLLLVKGYAQNVPNL